MSRSVQRLCVVGAGIGGLAAAALLAARGLEVTVLERAPAVGGKLRFLSPANGLTLREVFAALFEAAGARLEEELAVTRQPLLDRFLWPDGQLLDLFDDAEATAEAIGAMAGAEAVSAYRGYLSRARQIFEALAGPFLFSPRPHPLALSMNPAVALRLGAAALSPLWEALGGHFRRHPRLRQVFARAAAYVGCSPLLAPATLMMISHIEREGVWQVAGGLLRLAEALAQLAARHGAQIRCGAEVAAIALKGGRAAGVILREGGERLGADAVLVNADAMALGAGLFGPEAARAVPPVAAGARSFSAITWPMRITAGGELLATQTVLLPDEPTAEYTELQYRHRLPPAPSIQLARDGDRLLCMVSAPARADTRPLPAEAIAACGRHVQERLAGIGVMAEAEDPPLTPADFAAAFPGTGGALYGAALHGWSAAFQRPAAQSALPGLFLCGGGTHPGPGVAMAAISGRLAAAAILEERL
ncbi:MAG: FAD-dependent oxidoreductase [Rhodovarius sp.]|nr:FAD-dependent oxidoreductase [Rhodovarius sp.]